MNLKSKSFKNNEMIPPKYTCDGADINPPLEWENVPNGTQSFALIVDDPDAPGGTWIHWLVCDIPPDIRKIPENSIPKNATQVKNNFGKLNYGGPCPPGGTHRYFFKLYALTVDKLENPKRSNFYNLVETHNIAKAELMGKYKRK
jgi:hypothetical protein